jgi:hypothetical protein
VAECGVVCGANVQEPSLIKVFAYVFHELLFALTN